MPVKPNTEYLCMKETIAFEEGKIYKTDNDGDIIDGDGDIRGVLSESEYDFFLSMFQELSKRKP